MKPEAVSLFSGCGGSSLGYKMAGFKMLLANEFIPSAREVYKKNFPNTIMLEDDVRKISAKDILSMIGKKPGELDLLDGSPPCSSFSTAGRRNKGWGKEKNYSDDIWQRTDDLYFEFIRLLKGIQPKIFLSENVPSLTVGVNKGYFNEIFTGLQRAGYRVKACILSAKYFGVAQDRKRLFFMGIRNNFNVEPSFPKQKGKIVTCREALKNVINEEWELADARQFTNRWALKWLKLLKSGQRGCDIHPRDGYFSLIRIDMNDVAPTLTTLAIGNALQNKKRSGLCHSTEDRYLTISELKRICSFPDDFILTGNFSQQWERLARAVPPLLMKAIASHIKTEVLTKL